MEKKKEKKKRKGKAEKKKHVKEKKTLAQPKPRVVDINEKIYRNFLKFLEDKVSTECFIDLHDQCYGKAGCECECHTKAAS